MLTPLDDVITIDTDTSDDNQCQNESGCASTVLDTDVDMLLTVGSHEHSSNLGANHDEETVCMLEGEMISSDGSQSQLADENEGNNFSSEMDPIQVVEQFESTNENCSQPVSSADAELYICDDSDRAVDGHSDNSHPAVIHGEEPGSVHENEVLSIDVELQCSLVQHADENIKNDVSSDDFFSEVNNSDVECLQVAEEHSKTCSQSVPLANPEPYCCSERGPETYSIPQECFPISVDVFEPENESCVTDVAEIEIQDDGSDVGSTHEDSDSDCFIEDEFRNEAASNQSAESECEMNDDLLHYDHSYSLSVQSLQHSAVITSSNEICQEYTSQAGLTFSVPSLQAHDFNVATVLPFPSLINIDELCTYKQSQSGEHSTDNSSLFGVASMEFTDISTVSGLCDENSGLLMDTSSYPVVEIVPRSDEDEIEQLEQSVLSSMEPASTANTTTESGSVATSSSRRAKASIVTLFESVILKYVDC